MVFHRIDSTDLNMHQFGDVYNRCMGDIFNRYPHRFGYSNGRGAPVVVYGVHRINFAMPRNSLARWAPDIEVPDQLTMASNLTFSRVCVIYIFVWLLHRLRTT